MAGIDDGRLAAAMRLRGLWRAGVYHDWMDRAGRIRPATIRAASVIPCPVVEDRRARSGRPALGAIVYLFAGGVISNSAINNYGLQKC